MVVESMFFKFISSINLSNSDNFFSFQNLSSFFLLCAYTLLMVILHSASNRMELTLISAFFQISIEFDTVDSSKSKDSSTL